MLKKKKQSKKNPLGPEYPVLLIHGLFSRGDAWREIRYDLVTRYDFEYGGDYKCTKGADNQHIQAADFYTITFSSPFDLNFRQQGEELSQAIARIIELNNSEKIILIGHSMGGLAARAYLQLVCKKNNVFLLITLGTPHYGAPMALLRNSSEKWASSTFASMQKKLLKMAAREEHAQKNRGFFKRLWMKLSQTTSKSEKELKDFLTSSAFLALAPASDEIEELNHATFPTKTSYVFIIGDVSYQPILQTELVSRFRRKIARKWSSFLKFGLHSITKGAMAEPLNFFIKYCKDYNSSLEPEQLELLALDSDGVVPVASQFLHHLPDKTKLSLKLYADSWHMSQMRRTDKIYQALSLGGAFSR